MKLYELDNARTPDQWNEMSALERDGICVFCPNGTEPLHRVDEWAVRHNRYPYRGAQLHLLLAPDEHVCRIDALPVSARAGMWSAVSWVETEYNAYVYGLGIRNGHPAWTGATVAHLHVHMIVPKLYRAVRFTIGSEE